MGRHDNNRFPRGEKGTPKSTLPNYIVNWDEIFTSLDIEALPKYYQGFREIEGVRKEKGFYHKMLGSNNTEIILKKVSETMLVLTNLDFYDIDSNGDEVFNVYVNSERIIDRVSLNEDKNVFHLNTIIPLNKGDVLIVEKLQGDAPMKGEVLVNVGYVDVLETIKLEEIDNDIHNK